MLLKFQTRPSRSSFSRQKTLYLFLFLRTIGFWVCKEIRLASFFLVLLIEGLRFLRVSFSCRLGVDCYTCLFFCLPFFDHPPISREQRHPCGPAADAYVGRAFDEASPLTPFLAHVNILVTTRSLEYQVLPRFFGKNTLAAFFLSPHVSPRPL